MCSASSKCAGTHSPHDFKCKVTEVKNLLVRLRRPNRHGAVCNRLISSEHRNSTRSYRVLPAASRLADPGKETFITFTYATVALAFYHPDYIGLSATCFFIQPQGTSPCKRARSSHHARTERGCLIVKVTHATGWIQRMRPFYHHPVFSYVLAVASLSTLVHTSYQPIHGRRERH